MSRGLLRRTTDHKYLGTQVRHAEYLSHRKSKPFLLFSSLILCTAMYSSTRSPSAVLVQSSLSSKKPFPVYFSRYVYVPLYPLPSIHYTLRNTSVNTCILPFPSNRRYFSKPKRRLLIVLNMWLWNESMK